MTDVAGQTDAPHADELLRELRAVREIAHAFLMADRPAEVYQLALDRVTPLLGAAFSLIMHVDEDGEILRPVAQHEWPAGLRNWIGALRVRVGDGPSGVAVAERRLVEVPDLFADPALAMWYDVAKELGFRSIVAAPLISSTRAIGAIAFYFAEAAPVSDSQRALVRLVADQLAATADKSQRLDALRRSNAALAEANEALEHEAESSTNRRRERDQFMLTLVHCVRNAFARDAATAERTATVAEELAQVVCGRTTLELKETNPRTPLLEAIQQWRRLRPGLALTHTEPTVLLPSLQSDQQWLRRLLFLLLGQVVECADGVSPIHADVELGRGFIAHRLQWTGVHLPEALDLTADGAGTAAVPPRTPEVTVLDLALITALVQWLGGELQRDESAPGSAKQGVTLVFAVDDMIA